MPRKSSICKSFVFVIPFLLFSIVFFIPNSNANFLAAVIRSAVKVLKCPKKIIYKRGCPKKITYKGKYYNNTPSVLRIKNHGVRRLGQNATIKKTTAEIIAEAAYNKHIKYLKFLKENHIPAERKKGNRNLSVSEKTIENAVDVCSSFTNDDDDE